MDNKQRDIDLAISNILRIGVILSSILCAIGGVMLTAQDWNLPAHVDQFDDQLKTIPGIWQLACDGKPEGLIQLGVVVLVATPILRVLFAGLAFLKEKDYVYFSIASVVLAGLVYGLLFSK